MKASAAKLEVPNEGRTSDEGRSLMEDIQRMHTETAFVDMVFVCGEDEEEIGASRMVVAARSPVLKAMLLTSGMGEATMRRVPLPSIAPATMRICLEFFYTDTVQDSSWPRSILLAMKIVEAAVFFLVKTLQRLTLAYMCDFFTPILKGESSDQSFEFMEAYNVGARIFSAQENKSRGMRKVLSMLRHRLHVNMKSDTSQVRCVYKNLSQAALAHFSQMPPPDTQWALREYFSFVCLVKWSAYRLAITDPSVEEDELEEVLSRCFPESLNQLSTATNIDSNDVKISRFVKLISDLLAECLHIAPVDFSYIPTDILCKLIEPLGVIPPSTLIAAYKCQAFDRLELFWDQFCHGELYSIEADDLTVISCRSHRLKGFARCNMYLKADNMTCFDWRIVMLSPCENFRVGLCAWNPSYTVSHCNVSVLGEMQGSWALGSDGFLHFNFANERGSTAYVDAFCSKKGVVIEVHVDMVNRSCSFSINGKKGRVAWEDSLTDSYPLYPAISLQSPGKAQLEMVHPNWMDPPSKAAQSASAVAMSP